MKQNYISWRMVDICLGSLRQTSATTIWRNRRGVPEPKEAIRHKLLIDRYLQQSQLLSAEI